MSESYQLGGAPAADVVGIQVGQVYAACAPGAEGRRIRVTDYRPGAQQAVVVDAGTGARFRSLLARELHSTDTTRTGAPRRTGYALTAGPHHATYRLDSQSDVLRAWHAIPNTKPHTAWISDNPPGEQMVIDGLTLWPASSATGERAVAKFGNTVTLARDGRWSITRNST